MTKRLWKQESRLGTSGLEEWQHGAFPQLFFQSSTYWVPKRPAMANHQQQPPPLQTHTHTQELGKEKPNRDLVGGPKLCSTTRAPGGGLICLQQQSFGLSQSPLQNWETSRKSDLPSVVAVALYLPTLHWISGIRRRRYSGFSNFLFPQKITQQKQAAQGSAFYHCRQHQQGWSRSPTDNRRMKQTKIALQGLGKLNCHLNYNPQK